MLEIKLGVLGAAVPSHVGALYGPVGAEGAAVGFLAGVYHEVASEVPHAPHRLAAVGAAVAS